MIVSTPEGDDFEPPLMAIMAASVEAGCKSGNVFQEKKTL